ncbi:hypothetical protein G9G53_22460 [Paenibacillus sp. EKM206P]|uniref:DnaD domain protein n=1 Tax=Paenibacillus sp. EKM206P TaxID=1683674 RepID=UPI0013ECDE30|nr:DnaD domain protein [Paenibacillus sp. EKM206P]KAF6569058.1 hypothetical protein G9G53_22460 [Paenibacillus sp. EKM206P]
MTETARPTLSGLVEQFVTIGGPEEFGPVCFTIMVALWRKSEKLSWRRSFKMTNTELMLHTGIKSRDTLNTHRDKLVEAGMIGYIQPPRGSSKGDYSVPFDLLAVGEAVENSDHFTDNDDGVASKVVENFDYSGKAVGKFDYFSDTVLKDLSSSASSTSAAESTYESFYAAHERVFGFSCNPHQSDVLSKYIDEDGMEEAVVIRALERAALVATGPSFPLITRILNDYLAGRALTLDAAKAFDAAFDARKSGQTATGPPVRPQQTRQRQKTNDLQQRLKEEEAREQSGRNASVYRH